MVSSQLGLSHLLLHGVVRRATILFSIVTLYLIASRRRVSYFLISFYYALYRII